MKSKKTLQEHIGETPLIIGELLAHIVKETDRGAIISAAAALDDALVDLLAAFLRDNASTKKLIAGYDAPLGTFSSRIAMSDALGLLSKEDYADLETIRKIRNSVAHKWSGVTFKHDDLRSLARSLHKVSISIREAGLHPRECFNCAFSLLILTLINRAAAVKHLNLHTECIPMDGDA